MKMIKKGIIVLSALVCFSFIVGFAAAAQVEVNISDASGSVDETVDVPLTVNNAENIGSLDIVITYDPTILQVEGVSKGELNNGMISSNTDTDGILSIAIADQNGIEGDGEIGVISFSVVNETGSSPLKVESLSVYDTDSLELNAASEDGSFTVTESQDSDKSENGTPGFEFLFLLAGLVISIVAVRGKTQ